MDNIGVPNPSQKASLMTYARIHMNEVISIANQIDSDCIERMAELLYKLKSSEGRLFILGVGGSAGNASHAVNDFRKLSGIESYAPTDNISELSARTNDEGWETVFEAYLKVSNLQKKDCILVLSVGGGDINKKISVNLCRAIEYAKSIKCKVISIVGKEGGYAHENSDICLVIPPVNPKMITPHSESFQAIVWHLLVSHPKLNLNPTKW